MEGLTIRKKVMPRASQRSSGLADIPGLVIVAVLVLLALPLLSCFLLLAWIVGTAQKLLAPAEVAEPRTAIIHEVENSFFTLRYQYVISENISEGAKSYFGDGELVIRYRPAPAISFFDGYFSAFKVECPEGIFVQKVNFSPDLLEVESMPLYFFNYATRETAFIYELKDYLLETRGMLHHFTISADSVEDDDEDLELEITLTDAIRQSSSTTSAP